jgi:hypothetical protein
VVGHPRLAATAALLAVALLAVACGGAASEAPDDASQPAASVDAGASAETPSEEASEAVEAPGTTLTACEVITADDVTAATGIAAQPGVGEAKPNVLAPNYNECVYQGDYGRIVVQLNPDNGDDVFDAAKGVADDAKDIGGIGDGVFWTEQNRSLYAVKGKVNVLLRMGVGGDEEAVATELARRAIARL